jgi:beta-N-acetylhexosaminidase
VPALTDEKNPVTGRTIVSSLSHKILKDILRKELNFKGFAMSDALNMGGINNDYSASEMAVKAIAAGMDSLLAFNAEEIDSLHTGIVRAVENGTLEEKELDRAVRNVLTAKARLNLHEHGGMPVKKDELDKIILDTARYKEVEKEVSEKSITLLSNRNDIIPLDVAGKKVLTLNSYGPDRIVMESRGMKLCENFVAGFLKDAGAEVKDIEVAAVMTGDEANELASGIADAEIIIFNMFHLPAHAVGYNLFPNHRVSGLFYQGIFSKDIPIVVMSFGDPFIIDHCPSAPVYICAYNNTELSQKAAVDVCLGKLKPQGKSPVDFKYYIKYGDGLTV